MDEQLLYHNLERHFGVGSNTDIKYDQGSYDLNYYKSSKDSIPFLSQC